MASVNNLGQTAGDYTPTGNVITISVNCEGDNRALCVGLNMRQNQNVSSVTYNGVALTLELSQDAGNNYVYFYYLLNPAKGTHDLVINCTNNNVVEIITCVLNGIEQIGATASNMCDTTPPQTISATINVEQANSLILNLFSADPVDSIRYNYQLNGQTVITLSLSTYTTDFFYSIASSSGNLVQGATGGYAGKHGVMLIEFKAKPAVVFPNFLMNLV